MVDKSIFYYDPNVRNMVCMEVSIYYLFSVALSWCETWSLTLRDERRLRVSENRVLRTVFGPKRDEVTGE